MFTLTADQAAALATILKWVESPDRPYLVVGGYAGTGKTTLVSYLRQELANLKEWKNKSVAFCSYTGKAASVLRKKLAEVDALKKGDGVSTIHSLIYRPRLDEIGVITGWDRAATLNYNLIVVDEGSMLNQAIWSDLLAFRLPILVVGDHGQLPPIEGSFSLMQTADVRLERIVRQAADNPIIQLSQAIREGAEIPFGRIGPGVEKRSLSDSDTGDLLDSRLASSAGDTLVLCGRNRTRLSLNRQARGLQDRQSPDPESGDRVICLRNNHAKAMYNGMVGRIKRAFPEGEHWYDATISFDEQGADFTGLISKYQFNREKTLKREELSLLSPDLNERNLGDLFDYGYALTVHKAQGSEARRVVLFEERMQMYDAEMWRRWLYTGVTRAQEELLILA